jgi:dTMP kinase
MSCTESETGRLIEEKPDFSLPRRIEGSGCFITFEGIEGCGKSTQVIRLAARIERTGREVVVTREPGGTSIGNVIRSILLGEENVDLEPVAEMLLYAADRTQHIVQVIEPALNRGAVVLSDRFLDASVAYQGYGRCLGADTVLNLHRRPPLDLRPRRTVLLDMDPGDSLRRARSRNETLGITDTEGRFEQEEMAFHKRVREGYLILSREEPERFRVVDADGTPGAVEILVWEAVRDLLEAVH